MHINQLLVPIFPGYFEFCLLCSIFACLDWLHFWLHYSVLMGNIARRNVSPFVICLMVQVQVFDLSKFAFTALWDLQETQLCWIANSLDNVGPSEIQQKIFLSSATLLIVPPALIQHWRNQVIWNVRFNALKCLVISADKEYSNKVPLAHVMAWDYDLVNLYSHTPLYLPFAAFQASGLLSLLWSWLSKLFSLVEIHIVPNKDHFTIAASIW